MRLVVHRLIKLLDVFHEKYQQSLSRSFKAEVGAKRKNKKLTQVKLAELAGVSIPAIRQFENGRGQLGTAKKSFPP
jgi:DNA-binding transcriptional regulator YiaG